MIPCLTLSLHCYVILWNQKILGVGLNKTRRNSNWEERPLSQNQVYLSVFFFINIFHISQNFYNCLEEKKRFYRWPPYPQLLIEGKSSLPALAVCMHAFVFLFLLLIFYNLVWIRWDSCLHLKSDSSCDLKVGFFTFSYRIFIYFNIIVVLVEV